MQNHSTMRLIRFAVGMSVIAISAIGSAGASSRVERAQVIRQEAPTNRFASPISETDFRLSFVSSSRAIFLMGRAIGLDESHRIAKKEHD